MVDELDLVPEEFRAIEVARASPTYVVLENARNPDKYCETYVTFYTHEDSRCIPMDLEHDVVLDQIKDKAQNLLPTIKWKVMSGDRHRSNFEFTTNDQVWDAIRHSQNYKFKYLTVRLERAVNEHGANCDSCHRSIIGHRFKCTECSNFDICSSCESGSIHGEHAMLRIVGKERTRIPYWIKERLNL